MKKFFSGFKLSYLIVNIIVSGAFPFIFAMRAPEPQRLLKFTDSLTIVGFVLIIFGVVYYLYRKGDFDITQYVAKRSMDKQNTKPFDAYMEDKEQKRKETFNYPLFLGILYLIAAAAISFICF